MYVLILWDDLSTSVVNEKKVKYDTNGKVIASLNRKDFYPARVLRKHVNKTYLEGLVVSGDGCSLYSAKGRKLLCTFSPRIPSSEVATSSCSLECIVPTTANDMPAREIPSTKAGASIEGVVTAEAIDTSRDDIEASASPLVATENNRILATVLVPGPMKTELLPGSGLFVKTIALQRYQELYQKKSSKLALKLMRLIVGEENLKYMTPTGRRPYERLPKIAYEAVEEYVVLNATPKMSSADFQTTMKFLCRTVRKAAK